MSGHSKWANIKRKKGINDAARGKVFTKLSRLITIAVVEGGGIGNPDKNVRLRLITEKAKENNMPKENIQRAIDRAQSKEGSALKEVIYEGFAPHGVSLIISAATDNQNRSFNEIRSTLEKNNGKVGSPGSVIYNFTKCGMFEISKQGIDILALMEQTQALDVEEEDTFYVVYIPFEELGHVKARLGDITIENLSSCYRPQVTVQITEEQMDEVFKLIEALEELDDVQKVFSNLA